jgi:hypothetical protein
MYRYDQPSFPRDLTSPIMYCASLDIPECPLDLTTRGRRLFLIVVVIIVVAIVAVVKLVLVSLMLRPHPLISHLPKVIGVAQLFQPLIVTIIVVVFLRIPRFRCIPTFGSTLPRLTSSRCSPFSSFSHLQLLIMSSSICLQASLFDSKPTQLLTLAKAQTLIFSNFLGISVRLMSPNLSAAKSMKNTRRVRRFGRCSRILTSTYDWSRVP